MDAAKTLPSPSPDGSYAEKWETLAPKTLYSRLPEREKNWLKDFSHRHLLTFQEVRILAQSLQENTMWGEAPLEEWIDQFIQKENHPEKKIPPAQFKKNLFGKIEEKIRSLKSRPHDYSKPAWTPRPEKLLFEPAEKNEAKAVFGMCPAESKKTVCCNLRTIDAVQGCGFGCSYCTIQTFYQKTVTFDPLFRDKLVKIDLDPSRRYHVGTGQSSDSLIWGNREGILDALMDFARVRPKVLLELKTKSKNIGYFTETQKPLPKNIVLTWSLNPQAAVDHEEHFTASTEDRLASARAMADRGIPVGFHFHPMIWYQGWESDYLKLAEEVMRLFRPEEILFISIGSLTFIKPVIRQIREQGIFSKILQMELVENPDGKLTYPDTVKEKMFRHLYQAFAPWHKAVFFYICMEKKEFWFSTFGRSYETNELFEEDFLNNTFAKLESLNPA